MLASGGAGELFVVTLKNKRARPLVDALVSIVDRWAGGKIDGAWVCSTHRMVSR